LRSDCENLYERDESGVLHRDEMRKEEDAPCGESEDAADDLLVRTALVDLLREARLVDERKRVEAAGQGVSSSYMRS